MHGVKLATIIFASGAVLSAATVSAQVTLDDLKTYEEQGSDETIVLTQMRQLIQNGEQGKRISVFKGVMENGDQFISINTGQNGHGPQPK